MSKPTTETVERYSVFVPIAKFDEATGQVWGVIAEEKVDKDNEIFDYKTSKPNFQKWNDSFKSATDGKSLGNVRAMHGAVAAGKLIAVEYDDAAQKISVGAEIVDPVEREKVAAGVYTGFSIGAKATKWKDTKAKAVRYTADPFEVSIVDNPCMYGALFDTAKADGSTVQVKFVGGADKEANTPAPAAAATVEKTETAPAAAEPEATPETVLATVTKCMADVMDMAQLVAQFNTLRCYVKWEAELEGDGSDIPGRMYALQGKLAQLLVDIAKEESAELVADETGDMGIIELAAGANTKKRLCLPAKLVEKILATPPAQTADAPATPAPAASATPSTASPDQPATEKAVVVSKSHDNTLQWFMTWAEQVGTLVGEMKAMIAGQQGNNWGEFLLAGLGQNGGGPGVPIPSSGGPKAAGLNPGEQGIVVKAEGLKPEQADDVLVHAALLVKMTKAGIPFTICPTTDYDTLTKAQTDLRTLQDEVKKLKAAPAPAKVILRAVGRDGSVVSLDDEGKETEVAKSSPDKPASREQVQSVIKNIHKAGPRQ